jgi:hypothetical protein
MDKCIICGKNEVTWPLVCDKCKDHETQAQLALDYGIEVMEGPYGDTLVGTGMECRTCGMIYDGGMRCTYCGDPNPLNDDIDECDW